MDKKLLKLARVPIIIAILVLIIAMLNAPVKVSKVEEKEVSTEASIEIPLKEEATQPEEPVQDSVVIPIEEPAPKNGKILFVSSEAYSGNLRGLVGADTNCQDLANAAGLSGIFKALLSTRELDSLDRIVEQNKPYYDVEGTLIANDLLDLVNGNLANPPRVTEKRYHLPSNIQVWTGTTQGGLKKGDTERGQPYCYDWVLESAPMIGGYGQASAMDSNWLDAGVAYCNKKLRIYCIED